MPTIYQIAMPVMALLISGSVLLWARLSSAAYDRDHKADAHRQR
jgi:hypothetical protein